MKTREEILAYGLTFVDTYVDTPFSDTNWQLVRVKQSKKAFFCLAWLRCSLISKKLVQGE